MWRDWYLLLLDFVSTLTATTSLKATVYPAATVAAALPKASSAQLEVRETSCLPEANLQIVEGSLGN